MNRELEGLVALVTGAGNGIGQATALAFAREGARVVVSDIDGRGGEQTVVQIRQAGGAAQFAAADAGFLTRIVHHRSPAARRRWLREHVSPP